MSLRKRLIAGGVALGFAVTGWGFLGGAGPADADVSCTPLGDMQLCIDTLAFPHYSETGVFLSAPNFDPPFTGVLIACDKYDIYLAYALAAPSFSLVPLGLGALSPTVCP